MFIRMLVAVVASASAGFCIHVFYGEGWLNTYVQSAAEAGRLSNILQPPYPAAIMMAAYLTALVPYAVKVGIYRFAGHLLPARSAFARGLLYGLLLLALGDEFVRMPLMNGLVGNPVDVTVLMSLQPWAIALSSGVLIALFTPLRQPSHIQ
jgi:hypothetical protein